MVVQRVDGHRVDLVMSGRTSPFELHQAVHNSKVVRGPDLEILEECGTGLR